MDIFKLPVHPAADVFPMLDADELQELAADIKENGLREPLVVGKGPNGKSCLIDGRNRREGCKLAGVEPTTRELGEEDAVAFILSVNINRRHLTKGQRAMAIAMIVVTQNVSLRKAAKDTGQSRERIRRASVVLEHASDRAPLVLSGAEPLDEAYKLAQLRKNDERSEEQRKADEEKRRKAEAAQYLKRLEAVREKFPAIAARVENEDISLAMAEAAVVEQEEIERAKIQAAFGCFSHIVAIEDSLGRSEIADLCRDNPDDLLAVTRIDVAELAELLQSMATKCRTFVKKLKG